MFAHHGVLPEETRLGQRFYISLDCRLDLGDAGISDDVARTVSYADLAAVVVELATQKRFDLIEALAETIAAAILERFARIDSVAVRVDKPSAPVPAIIEGVAVEVVRTRAAEPER